MALTHATAPIFAAAGTSSFGSQSIVPAFVEGFLLGFLPIRPQGFPFAGSILLGLSATGVDDFFVDAGMVRHGQALFQDLVGDVRLQFKGIVLLESSVPLFGNGIVAVLEGMVLGVQSSLQAEPVSVGLLHLQVSPFGLGQ